MTGLRAVPGRAGGAATDADEAVRTAEWDFALGEAVLRRFELAVRTRLDGLLHGHYLGLLPGPGTEPGESREYVPGDDVRRMDWAVTARTQVPHIRQTVVDRELETWLVVDLSPSLDFGTARTDKRALVLASITALVHLTVRGGNRIGALVSTGEQSYRIPARAGLDHARHLVRRIAATPRAGASERGDVAQMLESLRRPLGRRGLVAVISDFLDSSSALDSVAAAPDGGEPGWQRPLRALSHHHQLLGVEVVDPRELELPAAGLVTFTDPETGAQLEVQTSDAQLRRNFADAAARQRADIAASLRHAGASHLQLRTDRDWLDSIVTFVVAQRQLAGAGAGQAVR